MKMGYIRVSTEEQNTARQEVLLRELGVDEVFIEKASGKSADRPELTRMMEYVRRGDTVIVESISRFARNTRDLLDLVERLTEKHVEFVSRKEAIDTTTPTGKFMLTVFAAVAELEREYILQRQREGIAIAKEQGKYTGRKPMPLPDNFERVVARWRAGEITAAEAMRQTGLRANTFYRRCNQHSYNIGGNGGNSHDSHRFIIKNQVTADIAPRNIGCRRMPLSIFSPATQQYSLLHIHYIKAPRYSR